MKFLLQIIFLCNISSPVFAAPHPLQQQADIAITALYLNNLPKNNMSARLESISAFFLGRKYILGALGEGRQARYDQWPRYRVDAFDCETYVTTVLALALANNLSDFKSYLRKIRYKDGKINYFSRNHFTSIDWNKNNQAQGFLRDITGNFKNQRNQPVATIARAWIDKPSWYQYHTLSNIRLINTTKETQKKRLIELKKKGQHLEKKLSELAYIPFTALFNKRDQINYYLLSQIPHAAIIEIVRPNWNVKRNIGTHLNISHLGFAFWKENKLFFREASSFHQHIVDVLLEDYLREAKKSKTIKGINVQVIIPPVSP